MQHFSIHRHIPSLRQIIRWQYLFGMLVLLIASCGQDSSLQSRFDRSHRWLSRSELIDRLRLYEAHIDQAEEAIRRHSAHNHILQRYLLGGRDYGCFMRRPLGEVTVKVSGHKLESQFVTEDKNMHRLASDGDPHTLTFEFNTDLSFSLRGDSLVQNGAASSRQLRDHLIGELRYLSIKKNGKGIAKQSIYSNRGCGFLWLSSCERFRFFETHIWRFHQLEIFSDKLLIYRKKLSYTFRSMSDSWQDVQFRSNQVFAQLAHRDDCMIPRYSAVHPLVK